MLAIVLNATEGFFALFSQPQFVSIEEVLNATASTKRKRGKRNG